MTQGVPRDFVSSVKICLNKYATFTGRAARPEFWWWALFGVIVGLIAGLVGGLFDAVIGGHFFRSLLDLLLFVAFIVPNLAVAVRRMHDIDRSGWWLLVSFIPVIGWIVLLVFYCLPGTEGSNRFGADPLRE